MLDGGSGVLDGRFLVELAKCEDAQTGKILDTEAGGNPGDAWPSDPLTLPRELLGPATRPSLIAESQSHKGAEAFKNLLRNFTQLHRVISCDWWIVFRPLPKDESAK